MHGDNGQPHSPLDHKLDYTARDMDLREGQDIVLEEKEV